MRRQRILVTKARQFAILMVTLFAVPDRLMAGDLIEVTEQLQANADIVWMLICAALVLLMQAGFMCVESAMSRAKNSINVAIKNLTEFLLATAMFWALA